MVKVVIASAILYYLGVSFWWWIFLVVAIIIDVYNEYASNMNDVRTVNYLRDISAAMKNMETK